jgi:two-component system, cell cycle sensor histidine kinase and response regulator CckA
MNKRNFALYAAWLIIVSFSFALNFHNNRVNKENLLLQSARSFFQEIVTTRLWNSNTKGIYSPVDEDLQPNSYLDHPYRDIETKDGLKLTMINPAYMTRQISEIAENRDGVKFHITSLNPIRPGNVALAWEKKWLESFENGSQEQYEFISTFSGVSLRYMAPLYVKQSCLKCHSKQGYKEGGIRGGISITMPPYSFGTIWEMLIGHVIIAFFGFVGLFSFNASISRNVKNIQEKEEKYREVFEENSTIKLLVDPDNGRIVDANEAACQFYGYERTQILSLKMSTFNMFPEETLKEKMASTLSGEKSSFFCSHKLASGEIREVEVYSGPIFLEGKTLLFSVIHDVTEKKNREKELYFMKLAVDKSEDSAFWIDSTGKLFYVNESAYKNLGYTREELLNMTVSDFDHNFPTEIWSKHWQELQSKKHLRLETSHRSKDGNVFPVEVTVNLVEYEGKQYNCSFARDISERVNSEAAINRQNKFLKNIIESLPYPFYVIDASSYALVMANSSASPHKDWVGKTCYNLTHCRDTPCDGDDHCCTLAEVKKTKKPVKLEHIHYDSGGNERNVEISGYPIFDESGNIVQLIEYSKDITEQKLAEKNKKKMELQLAQTYKMESVGTLAGGIAHDFNNILSAIIGYAELIQQEVAEKSQVSKDVREILGAAGRATNLVKQILTFSRKDGVQKELLYPHLIVKEALIMLHATIPASIGIEDSIVSDCGTILANPTNIYQIIINLCTNARHALPDEKGTISIQLYSEKLTEEQMPPAQQVSPGTFIVLSVSDTGCGMDKETRNRIFEPYYTTKEKGAGTGLGLSVVLGVVQNCKGFIKVESDIGKGSKFSVYFPANGQSVIQPVILEKTHTPRSVDGAHILMVDDEHLLLEINKRRLEKIGYRVTAMLNSLEAIEAFRQDPEQFDLLITDQTMPGLTGEDLAKAVLEVRPSMPIIMCTGHSDTVSEELALSLGIKKYVHKPILGDDLVEAVQEILE